MSKILEGIEGLTDTEKIKELDDRIRAYQDTIVELKAEMGKLCEDCYKRGERNVGGNKYIISKSRTTNSVNNEMLYLSDRELYDELSEAGLLVVPNKVAEDYADRLGVALERKTTQWYEVRQGKDYE